MKSLHAIGLSIFLTSFAASADFDYPNFTSVDAWHFNADAAQAGDRIRLTPAAYYQRGSAWYRFQEPVTNGFHFHFQFQISDIGTVPNVSGTGGDGFALVIHNDSLTAIGDYGWGIGYSGVDGRDAIANSVAIEFDTWRNAGLDDPNANHVSVHTRGSSGNHPHEDYSLGSTTMLPDMKAGGVHTAIVTYIPGAMTVFVDDLHSPALTVPIDLDSRLAMDQGRAWLGFTSSTWNGWANHDILSASFGDS